MNKQDIIDAYRKSKIYQTIDKMISVYFRRKLKNSNFSILCSNCMGGIIYHRLGHIFLSPTINMWFDQTDFVYFLLHLDAYLEEPLCFVATSEATPVATMGGHDTDLPLITLHFNHASSEKDAARDWNRRKKRINRDNLYIIMYLRDGLTVSQAHLLDHYPCKNKVIFTEEPIGELSWSYYLAPNLRSQYPNPTAYLGKDVFGVRWYEKKWDFISFLNTF